MQIQAETNHAQIPTHTLLQEEHGAPSFHTPAHILGKMTVGHLVFMHSENKILQV